MKNVRKGRFGMKRKIYAVFGLGRYGSAVALELSESGAEVLAVDANENIVSSFSDRLPLCKCADVTDPEVIKQLGVSNVDVVIISMAGNLEASVMATTLCKEAGVETVIVKCANEMHKRILKRVGADKVTVPESESGVRMAKTLLGSGIVDLMEPSDGMTMAEIEVRDEWTGKSLSELNLRRKYSVNVIAIKEGGKVKTEIDPAVPLTKSMKLIAFASTAKLGKLH